MTRWLIVMAFALVLPIYGQKERPQAASDKGRTEATNTPEAQAVPPPNSRQFNPINEQTPRTQQNGTKDQPESYLRRLFSPENLPNIGLFIAGVIGIVVAIRTLKAIQRQARANEEQLAEIRAASEQTKQLIEHAGKHADAAKLSAQTVINAERAWVDISLDLEAGGKHALAVANMGKSPAFITEAVIGRGYWQAGAEIPVGSTGTVVPETLKMYNILGAGDRKPLWIFDVFLYPDAEEGQVCSYHGQVTYRDIFGQEHRTEVVYRRQKPGRLRYLPEYTRYITTAEQDEKAN